MRLSFLAAVVALTASMSVSACSMVLCNTTADCCPTWTCDSTTPLTCDLRLTVSTASRLKIELAAGAARRNSELCFCFRFGSIMVDETTRRQFVANRDS
ncbi:uncharacterized protein HD556DRAFT_1356933 [Suillus plorans]|uniref:Uncharacterized protein n=1 Tax=Suillus plorans TaxID=116603 RepID=A0A9P7IYL2_9AGAM|nr:uncharacterized protein HD556DRAFT_1356933 [Suillus plorans]KAG1797480.1 hypothetical protein HD556DRAFT_1356933 [Suillus plorans]